MNSNAPGQLLGYILQLPRAVIHLLKGGAGEAVCVEVYGDVATRLSNGSLIAEEDKSSLSGNPLTDRSTNLWKTFFNWITAINNGELNANKTRFVLYCNRQVKGGMVNKFSAATSPAEAQAAIDNAKTTLSDIKKGHEIWEYYNFVLNKNAATLKTVIQNFDLQVGEGAGFDDVRAEIRRKHVSDTHVEYVLESLNGWLQKVVATKIAAHEPPIIKWEDYDRYMIALLERLRTRELIDFTLQKPLASELVSQHVNKRPIYVQQLDHIGILEENILEAVIEYLKADVNRSRWIEEGLLDENAASDFEAKLKTYWKNQCQEIKIAYAELSENKKGQMLLSRCRSRQEAIGDKTPPASTIPGTYHALANRPVLGWHSDWERLFPKK